MHEIFYSAERIYKKKLKNIVNEILTALRIPYLSLNSETYNTKNSRGIWKNFHPWKEVIYGPSEKPSQRNEK